MEVERKQEAGYATRLRPQTGVVIVQDFLLSWHFATHIPAKHMETGGTGVSGSFSNLHFRPFYF